MCGPHSALGLEEAERRWWPHLRERLRERGQLMALMRGVLGGDAEVAAVASVTPAGITQPLAVLATPVIAGEITLTGPAHDDRRPGRIGEYDIEVLVDPDDAEQPIAVLVTPWIYENLTLFTRKLWSRR